MLVSDSSSNAASSRSPRPKRGGLGRGLGSLIPTTPVDLGSADSVAGATVELPIDRISPNPYQPRKVMDPDKLQDLADSIRLHGLVQPLIVTRDRDEDRYLLIAGERRWRAAAMAGFTAVPVVVREAAPQDMLELAIIENVVRADLGPLEEATSFRQLIDEFGLSQSEVATRVGRSRAAVANTLRLLNAPDQVQAALASEAITEGHARAILGLDAAADQLTLLQMVIDQGLNVRQTEAHVRRWDAGGQSKAPIEPTRQAEEVRLEDRLRTALGTRVALKRTGDGRGGSLTIQFFSDDQLQAIYDKLVGEDIW
jgi:ParB family chromosome partitioning protein